jgi:hypothetical protein
VASDPVVSRLVTRLAADSAAALAAIGAARAAARQRAWALAGDQSPGADGGLIPVDIDATIVTAHSDKQQAAPTWKKTFGFQALTVFADHGSEGSGEPLAIMLRPGNAGSNTAADHIAATRLAIVHEPVAFRDLIQVHGAVEDPNRVDFVVQDVRHEALHVRARRADAAGQCQVAHTAALLKQLPRHHHPLDLVGALVDLGDRGPADSLRRSAPPKGAVVSARIQHGLCELNEVSGHQRSALRRPGGISAQRTERPLPA